MDGGSDVGLGEGSGPAKGRAGPGMWLGLCVCHISLLWFSIPSLCHLEHPQKSLWTSRYESYLDPVSASGNHHMEIRLGFRSCGWALREQEPAQAVCSGLHELCLGLRHCCFVLVHILGYQLVHLCIAIYEN